jgi:hypothetical protein
MDLIRYQSHGGNLLCRLGAFPLLQCYFHYRHSVCTLDSPRARSAFVGQSNSKHSEYDRRELDSLL